MRRRTRVAVAVTATALAMAAVPATAPAAPEDIPWFERPVTVGTGFRHGDGGTFADAPVVSASGRWVAFTTTATELLPDGLGSGVFVRDRWTDTTVRITSDATRRARPTVMSHDGNIIGGVAEAPGGGPGIAWLHDQRTHRTTDLPVSPGFGGTELVGVNNDGYFMVRDVADGDGPAPLMRSGRLAADGTIGAVSVTARGSREFLAVTPSLQFAVAVVARPGAAADVVHVDLTTGALTSAAATLAGAPGALAANRSVAVSPDGGTVAMSWTLPDLQAVRIWDVAAGTAVDHIVPDGYDARPVALRAVLDDGRVIYDTVANAVLFADPVAHPDAGVRVLDVTFGEGAAAPIQFDELRRSGGQVATDIDRVLICTTTPMSAYAPAFQDHCYLVPFPPSPLALR